MTDRAAEKIKQAIAASVEAPVHADQKDIELKLLATLATVINSEQADLKYDLLALHTSDFHFRDHRDIFAAMKELADAGDHVDQTTVRARIKDAWPEALKSVFDGSKADAAAAGTYKRQVVFWSTIEEARRAGHAYLAAVEKATGKPDADLPGLVAGLQKSVFDIGKMTRLAPETLSVAELLDDFIRELANPTPGYKPGFEMLEKVIRGLTPGLFVIAAPPSAGKTTYLKQLADQVAAANEAPVLFFSYEQSAAELHVKSLARLSKEKGDLVTNEAIKGGESAGDDAVKEYRRIGKHLKVIECDRRNTIGDIRLKAQKEKKLTGKAPVIFIDYLQIIPAADQGQNDRRAEIDLIVSELRRIARDIEAPVVVISSMSRQEYRRARMMGFKESGGIEYGADIAAILTVESEDDKGKKRSVALNIIKNRNGRRGKIGMDYDMEYDHFVEADVQFLSYLDTLGKEQDHDDER